MDTNANAVAIVTGSDTVSTAIGCMETLRKSLPEWCDIVLAYSMAPNSLKERVRLAAGNRHVTLIESEIWQRQNQLRNLALESLRPYDFYLFLDLDSRIEAGCLERCIHTHKTTGADLVGGIVYYGSSIDFGIEDKQVIHFAGGKCLFRPDADGRPGFERVHHWVPKPVDELRKVKGDRPWNTELVEYHGVSLSRRAVEVLAPLDTNLLALEETDLSLKAASSGLKMVIDPLFEVTYVGSYEYLCDIRPYTQHWGTDAVQESVRYFAKKYGLPPDGELIQHQTRWNRQHFEDIGTVRRLSFAACGSNHPYSNVFAETTPQLLQQLHQQGWSEAEISRVKHCSDVGTQLAKCCGEADGQMIFAQLVATASLLASCGAPPIMVESALVHPAYDEFGVDPQENGAGSASRALAQRVGPNVDRVIRGYGRQDFRTLRLPQGDDDLALYPLDIARRLLIRVAIEIQGHRNHDVFWRSADADAVKQHARAVLPALGFSALLSSLERSLAESKDLAPCTQNYNPKNRHFSGRIEPDSLALPDEKWIEVASFLRQEGREAHVVFAPNEFAYLCEGLKADCLSQSDGLKSDEIAVLHKGRLAEHSNSAVAELLSAIPILANDVFVVFSKSGTSVKPDGLTHVDPIRQVLQLQNV